MSLTQKNAARSGVDIKIIIPDKPDHIFMYWNNLTYAYDLMKSGVRVYRYNRGFIHEKMMLMDDDVASVGSANLDNRSITLNFETNIMMYSERMCDQMLRQFTGDLEAHEIWTELREVSFGVFEGFGYDALKGRADYEAWLAGDWFRNVPPGGESFAQAEARILSGLRRMQAQPEDVFAVVHGGTILTIMQALFPEEGRSSYDWQPKPGGGYRIDLPAHRYDPIGIVS